MKVKVSCEDCLDYRCFVNKHCSQEWISTINDQKNQVRYRSGSNIIIEGNPVMGLYFICQGKVKVTTSGLKNKEQIVRLAADGHILGHRGFGGETYPIGAVAMEDSLICFLKNDLAREIMMDNPEFTYGLMMFYSQELCKSERRIKHLAQMTIKERVAEALLYLLDTFGVTSERKLDVNLSRREIGELAGTNAEQVSRAISEFKKEDILDTVGKEIIISKPKMFQEIVGQYDGHR